MVSNLSKLEEINVLASESNRAWPEALRDTFRPRGVTKTQRLLVKKCNRDIFAEKVYNLSDSG